MLYNKRSLPSLSAGNFERYPFQPMEQVLLNLKKKIAEHAQIIGMPEQYIPSFDYPCKWIHVEKQKNGYNLTVRMDGCRESEPSSRIYRTESNAEDLLFWIFSFATQQMAEKEYGSSSSSDVEQKRAQHQLDLLSKLSEDWVVTQKILLKIS